MLNLLPSHFEGSPRRYTMAYRYRYLLAAFLGRLMLSRFTNLGTKLTSRKMLRDRYFLPPLCMGEGWGRGLGLSTLLLLLLAACQPAATPTPVPLPASAWGPIITLAQAEQADAPALAVDEKGVIA